MQTRLRKGELDTGGLVRNLMEPNLLLGLTLLHIVVLVIAIL